MTALETVAQKLITELAQAQCFGSDGRVQDREASHKILDVPFLHISMLDIVTATHCYANTCVAKRAGIPGGWLTSDRIHAIGLVFDPMSFQRVLSELDRYSQGATQSQSGVLLGRIPTMLIFSAKWNTWKWSMPTRLLIYVT